MVWVDRCRTRATRPDGWPDTTSSTDWVRLNKASLGRFGSIRGGPPGWWVVGVLGAATVSASFRWLVRRLVAGYGQRQSPKSCSECDEVHVLRTRIRQ